MSCDRFDLSAYVDGELSARAREAVVQHLAGCEACRAEVADLTALAQALRGPEPPPLREAALEAAVARSRALVIERAGERPSPWRTLTRLFTWRISVPAPALALALVLLAVLLVRAPRPERPGRPALAAERAVYQEWDASALWEEPSHTNSEVRVLVDERVEI